MDPTLNDQHRVLNTEQELVAYFRDLTRNSRSFNYSGFRVEIHTIGVSKSLLWVFLYTPLYDIYEKLFHSRPRGLYLRVFHALPLHADLVLMNEKQPRPNRSFEEAFYWDALDREAVQNSLSDEIKQALVMLDKHYAIKMRDDYLEFGPILYEPTEAARHLKILLASLPKPIPDEQGVELNASFSGKVLEDGEFITVARTTNDVQANLWKLALESEGVPSQLFNAQTSCIYGGAIHHIDIQLVVPISYKEQAIAIVSDNRMSASAGSSQEEGYQE